MALKSIVESELAEKFNLRLLNTNFRRSNTDKGRFGLAMIFAFFKFVWVLVLTLTRVKPHLVYYFVTATKLGWLGKDVWCIAISKLLGAKIVIHLRAGHFRSGFDKWSVVSRAIVRSACRCVDRALVQGESLRSQFEGLCPKDSIAVVPNAIDTYKYYNSNIYAFGLKRFLFLGHLSVAKGYCEILQAIPAVAEKHPDVIFEFAGAPLTKERNVFVNQITGENLPRLKIEQCLRDLENAGFSANYSYLGELDEDEKIKKLAECNALLLPSYSEGFSMAILEAMSMAKPVICTPVGALKDVVANRVNGLLVNPGEPQAIAEAVLELIENQELRTSICRSNLETVRKNYTQERVSDLLEKQFREALVSN